MWQTYHTCYTVEDALDILATHREQVRIMAGGTDLIVEIQRGLRSPKVIVDISRIPGLDTISQDGKGWIHIGPLVTHNQVVGSDLCVDFAYPLVKACWEVGAPQIRNRATIAGNLVTASPANDTITPLYALDAIITVRSVRGSRTLTCAEFFQGARETALEPDEMIVDIAFDSLKPDEVGTFLKLGLRRSQAISVVNVAIVLKMLADTVTQARIAMGSVAPTVIRAKESERFMTGKVLAEDVISQAGALAAQTVAPISDIRGSAEYRRYMVKTLARHALVTLSQGTERDHFPPRPVMLWGETNGHFATNGADDTTVHGDEEPIVTTINGQAYTLSGGNHKTLLRLLREDAGLIGTKEGCAEGECGSCTVFLDGIAVMSCMVAAPRAHDSEIVTIEGLANGDELHPVQEAFIEEGAVQCGYCTPGFVMSGASLMDERHRPTRDELKQAITGNLCRCTGYYKILQALDKASLTNAKK